jgi:hypothetical protein
MPFAELEEVYELLADGIDRAGPRHETLFLARLAMLLAHRLGDLDSVRECRDIALAGAGPGAGAS